MLRSFTLIVFLLASIVTFAEATTPHLINYQGVLTNAGGGPLSGTMTVTFSIYDVSSGANPRWTETQTVTADAKGRFNVLLGAVVTLSDAVFDQPSLWLGVRVALGAELQPRTQLASVPFAERVSTLDGANGGTVQGLNVMAGMGINTMSPTGALQVVTTNDAQPGNIPNWDGRHVVMGADGSAGGVAVSYDVNANKGYVTVLKPNVEWGTLFLNTGGSVAVGGQLPLTSARLHVTKGLSNYSIAAFGNTYTDGCVYSSSGCFATSDGRYKNNIAPISDILAKLKQIRGVTYEWNDAFTATHPMATGKQLGVVAQEVEGAFPELVSTTADGYKAVDYGRLAAVLLEAVKEQQSQIEDLRKSIETLKKTSTR